MLQQHPINSSQNTVLSHRFNQLQSKYVTFMNEMTLQIDGFRASHATSEGVAKIQRAGNGDGRRFHPP